MDWRRSRRIRMILWAGFIGIAASLVTPAADAQTSARELLQPVVTHQQFSHLIGALAVSRDQRMVIDMVFADYLDTLEHAASEADAAADAAGRQAVLDALSGRIVIPSAELRELRLNVLQVYRDMPAEAAALIEKLLGDVHAVLMPEQRARFEEAAMALRRHVHLEPRRRDARDHEYAGDGIDVALLFAEATGPGGPLTGLREELVRETLGAYHESLDAALRTTDVAWRTAAIDRRMALLVFDDHAAAEAERGMLAAWDQLYRLHEQSARAIGDATRRSLGETAQAQWMLLFREATFPWLFRPGQPDRQLEWLAAQHLDDVTRQSIEETYESYRVERDALLNEAAALMLRARRELGVIIHPMMDPEGLTTAGRAMYQTLLRNSGELASLEGRAAADIEADLDEATRTRLRQALRAGSRRR